MASDSVSNNSLKLIHTNRNKFISSTLLLTSAALLTRIEPALCKVGEGSLPESATVFFKIIQTQKDWTAIGDTVRNRNDISNDEWKNIQLFLRKFYQMGDAMNSMSKNLLSPKREEAMKIVEQIKIEVKSLDKLANEKSKNEFLMAHESIQKKMGDFVTLFQDVPDEL
eukprot:CAMPEP_0171457646 /NCGR_PEP_ID=MMETSP0945-20130129/3641_1 /TAXON_ID=109269 /ORGANISM="Vaucheria litorea, Strain CCMP2940" /LENGTH=167 /DNA_ID=CAMNT_0011983295 /DNA_START=98 /DNA_END=597 /DNA_ORIENTATION=-